MPILSIFIIFAESNLKYLYMKKEIVSKLYDLLVFITCNYSKMSDDFRSQFPEGSCVSMRQGLFNALSDFESHE